METNFKIYRAKNLKAYGITYKCFALNCIDFTFFSFVRKLKDFSIHYSSDGSISISDSLLIQVSGDEDETKSVLVSWSHQVSQYSSTL